MFIGDKNTFEWIFYDVFPTSDNYLSGFKYWFEYFLALVADYIFFKFTLLPKQKVQHAEHIWRTALETTGEQRLWQSGVTPSR